jgi:hypothetical protein
MARLIGKKSDTSTEPIVVPIEEPPGKKPGPVIDAKSPTLAEIMEAISVNNDALQASIAMLIERFPLGIPPQLLFDTINNAVSRQALYLKIGEVYVALQKFSQNGKGPVGNASVELV